MPRRRRARDESRPTLRKLWSEFRVNPLRSDSFVLADGLEEEGFKRLAREIRNLVVYGREVVLPDVLRPSLEQPISRARARRYAYLRENSLVFARKRFDRVHSALSGQIIDAISWLEKKKPVVRWWVDRYARGAYQLVYPMRVEQEPREPVFIPPNFYRRPGHGVVLAGRRQGEMIWSVEKDDLFDEPPPGHLLAPRTKHWLPGYR